MDLFLHDEHGGIGGDAFLATCETEVLSGGGFDAYLIGGNIHKGGKDLLHLGDVGIEFGTLCTDGAIDIAYLPASLCQEVCGAAEEDLGVDAFVLIALDRGKVVTDIAHVGCSEEGITDGMDEHISIGVTKESMGVGNENPAKPELAMFCKLMDIVAHSYSYVHTGSVLRVTLPIIFCGSCVP